VAAGVILGTGCAVAALADRRRRLLIGLEARFFDAVQRIMPVRYPRPVVPLPGSRQTRTA
jgi:hypothetical protein